MSDYFGTLLPETICVWLAFWAIRRKYDVDYPLSGTGQIVRWVIVIAAVVGGQLRAKLKWEPLRLTSAILYLSFVVWPNLAYHLLRCFDRLSARIRMVD
jgi:hypothetical protein